MKGVFIAFEGPEGGGKSTQLRLLARSLEERGLQPLLTKEPGGTPVGERIREIVLLEPELYITPLTEFLLYTSSRAQHVGEVIRPALDAGRLVLCDRFTGASAAYQGYGRGLPLEVIDLFTRQATGGLKPDLTLLFDLEPEVGLARVAQRGEKDRLEQADLGFHRRVREGFLKQAEADPTWVTLDATLSAEALQPLIWEAVRSRFPGLHTRSP